MGNNSGLDGALFLADLETIAIGRDSFARTLAARREGRRVDMTGAYNDLVRLFNRLMEHARGLEAQVNAWKKAHQSMDELAKILAADRSRLQAENQALRDRLAKWE